MDDTTTNTRSRTRYNPIHTDPYEIEVCSPVYYLPGSTAPSPRLPRVSEENSANEISSNSQSFSTNTYNIIAHHQTNNSQNILRSVRFNDVHHQQFQHSFQHQSQQSSEPNSQSPPTTTHQIQILPTRLRRMLNTFAHGGNVLLAASESMIDSIKEYTVDATLIANTKRIGRDMKCAICLVDMQLHEHIKQLTCQHMYHVLCISTWLRMHASCPLCRAQLPNIRSYPSNTGGHHRNNSSYDNQVLDERDPGYRRALRRMQRRHRQRHHPQQNGRVRSRSTSRTRANVAVIDGGRSRSTSCTRRTVTNSNIMNSNGNDDSMSREQTANRVLRAVIDILGEWSTVVGNNISSTVNADVYHHNHQYCDGRKHAKYCESPYPSRSGTKTRNSLPDFQQIQLQLKNWHSYTRSSPPPRIMNANGHQQISSGHSDFKDVEEEESVLSNVAQASTVITNDNEFKFDDKKEHEKSRITPISASVIRNDFARYNRQRKLSRLQQSSDCPSIQSELQPLVLPLTANAHTFKVVRNCKQMQSPETPTPILMSPQTHVLYHYFQKKSSITPGSGDGDGTPMPDISAQLFRRISSATVIEKMTPKMTTPVLNSCNLSMEDVFATSHVILNGTTDSLSSSPPLYDPSVIQILNSQQLEILLNKHKNAVRIQSSIVDQIRSEMNSRSKTVWKCPKCLEHTRAFLLMPCRHLGLCTFCNSESFQTSPMKCPICANIIEKKIPINFQSE